ncbi:HYR domain-containing protein, partial [Cellulophaga baltica]|uniref:Ig-like domain-containing protein n=1 Tax=Cellulophaga TaxID=104264 RepID=UPI001C07D8A8
MNRRVNILYRYILIVVVSFIHFSFIKFTDFSGEKNNVFTDENSILEFAPPTFTGCDASSLNVQVTYTAGTCGGTVTWNEPTASSDAVSVTSNYQPGDNILPGTTAIVYRAENAAGEIGICTFNVEVEDNEDPVFSTFPADVTLTADPNTCTASYSWDEPEVSDNCPAGEGYAPVLQDFESSVNQCYELTRSSISTSGEINGTNNYEATSLSIADFFTSSLVTPVLYFNGEGEISFSHSINTIGNNAEIHVDIYDGDDNLVQADFFSEIYSDTDVQQENIPFTLTGNYKIEINYSSSIFNNTSQVAYLDDLLLPGTIVTNLSNPDCDLSELSAIRTDGNGKVSGDDFEIGTTTIKYTLIDSYNNLTFDSFNITVVNDLNAPTGASEYTYCEGDSIPEMEVVVDETAGETANWYDSSGNLVASNTTTYTAPSSTELYRNYSVYSENANGCSSDTFISIDLIQYPLPSAPTSNSPIEYCVGDTSVPLVATGDSGNTLQWFDASTGGTMYTSDPTPNTTSSGSTFYYVEQVSSFTGCVSPRTEVEVIVHALPTAPILYSNTVNYCVGESAEQLDNSVETGANLTWYDAATGGNTIAGTTIPDTTTSGTTDYWVTETETTTNCESTRTRLRIIVTDPPVVTVQPNDIEICEYETAVFTATVSNANSYQWQIYDGANWVDLSDTSPYSNTSTSSLTVTMPSTSIDNTNYRLVASSSIASCFDAVSEEKTLTVNPQPSAPTVSDVEYCQDDTASSLTAGGANLLWYTIATGGTGSTTAPTPDTTSSGTTSYYVSQTNSNGCESPRSELVVTVYALPSAPTVSDVEYCQNDIASALTAGGTNLLWYTTATGGTGSSTAPTPSTATVGDTSYYVSQTNANGCEGPRSEIIVTTNSLPTAPSVTSPVVYCQNDTASALTASGTNLLWYTVATGGTGSSTAPTPSTATVGNTSYYVSQTNANGCEGPRSEIVVTVNPQPSAPTVSDVEYCQDDTASSLTAGGTNLLWYTVATGGTGSATAPTPDTTSSGTTSYYVTQTNGNGCESPRSELVVTVYALPSAPTVSDVEYCQNDTASALTAGGTNLLWYTTATGGTGSSTAPMPSTATVGDTSYYVSQTNANGCEGPRSEIIVTINSLPTAPSVTSPVVYCQNDTASALTASGTNLLWYTLATGGTGSSTAPTPSTATVGNTSY